MHACWQELAQSHSSEGKLRVLVWGQDSERGRQSSLTTLLAEVSERGMPKPSREEADRLKRDVCHLLPRSCLACLGHMSLCDGLTHVHQAMWCTDRTLREVTIGLLGGGWGGGLCSTTRDTGPLALSPIHSDRYLWAYKALSTDASSGHAEHDAEGGGAEAAGEDPRDGGGDVPPAAALER